MFSKAFETVITLTFDLISPKCNVKIDKEGPCFLGWKTRPKTLILNNAQDKGWENYVTLRFEGILFLPNMLWYQWSIFIKVPPLLRKIVNRALHLMKKKLQKQSTQPQPSVWPLDNLSMSWLLGSSSMFTIVGCWESADCPELAASQIHYDNCLEYIRILTWLCPFYSSKRHHHIQD